MTSRHLSDLVDSYLDVCWHFNPVEATVAGLSAFDHLLGRFGVEQVLRHLAALRSIANALEETSVASLQDEIDRTALLNHIRFTEHRFTQERPHELNPEFWISHVLDGLYFLLVRRDRPASHRATAVEERLKAVPDLLALARETLTGCPRVFVETATLVAEAGLALVHEVAASVEPADPGALATARDEATDALGSFQEYLDAELLPGGDGGFAIGEAAFTFRLQFEHALSASAAELWRYGASLAESVEHEVAALAREIRPDRTWQEVAHELRDDHPGAHELVAAYAQAMVRARSFVEERALVTIPPGQLEVVETPSFLQPLIPFAAYQPPGPFAADRTGLFYVSKPDGRSDADAQARWLRDHCRYELAATALHEGYPGHHLQFLAAQAQPRTVRKVVATPLTYEGWALYCEEMMGEEGYYRSVEERLFQRVALLWRAVRVMIDVGLHTGRLGFDDAVRTLVDRIQMDRRNAEAEIRRCCAEPAYQLCYAVGRREWRALRDDYRAARGSEYSLRAFHDAVLAYGGLPVTLIRWGMGL